MENKNILYILIAIGFVFLILIGSAIFFVPGQNTETEPQIIDMNSSMAGADNTAGAAETAADAAAQDSGTQSGVDMTMNGDSDLINTLGTQNNDVAITQPVTTGEKEKTITISLADKETDVKKETAVKPQTHTTTTAAKTTGTQQSTHSAPVKTEPTEKKEPRLVYIREYWIQTASFKNRSNAEKLNTRLTELGYPGTIKTKLINGDTYFRIRIGPYSSNNEADKFLIWIKSIDGLEQSYISQVTTQKYID